MIQEIKMYTVICDNCNIDANYNSEYIAWKQKEYAEDIALDQEWKIINKKHYCPDCWSRDDNDEIVIKNDTNN